MALTEWTSLRRRGARQSFFLLDRDLRVRAVNEVGRAYVRRVWQREIEVGASMLDYSTSGDAVAFLENAARALAGESVTLVRSIEYPSGQRIWYEVSYAPVTEGGLVTGVVFSAVDVTEERSHVEWLLLFQSALAQATTGVIITEAGGDHPIVFVNDAICRITGFTREEFLGRNCRFLQRDDREQPGLDTVRRALQSNDTCVVQVRNYRKDGSVFLNELALSPIRSASGRVTHFVGLQDDVTERERIRSEVHAFHRARLVGRLFGGVSHEVGNALQIVSLELDALRASLPADAQASGALEPAQRAVARAEALAKGLARLGGSGAARPAMKHDLRACIEGLAPTLARLFGAGVTCRYELAAGAIVVRVDRLELEQVLLNLAINAVDAMAGLGTVTVRLYLERQPSRPGAGDGPVPDIAVIEVHDEGPGVAADAAPKLFEPFFTTKGEYGTGLGLAVSRDLVRRHGGDLSLGNAAGRGACFRLQLPLADDVSG